MILSVYIPICDAIVRLMDPLVEIIIHDISQNTVAYINGNLSRRKIGDPSLLEPEGLGDIDRIVYPKINFDGRLIKSVSLKLEDKYLLCINCDISIFNKMRELSGVLLQTGN